MTKYYWIKCKKSGSIDIVSLWEDYYFFFANDIDYTKEAVEKHYDFIRELTYSKESICEL